MKRIIVIVLMCLLTKMESSGGPDDCGNLVPGIIAYKSTSYTIGSQATPQLNKLATSMRANPNCTVVVTGNGNASKVDQQRSWDRVNAVINYMVNKQRIDRDRFIFQYGQNGNANFVNYRAAVDGEEGPSIMPPPFPNSRKK